MGLAKLQRVDKQHQIAARPKYARDLAATLLDKCVAHLRELTTPALAGTLVAVGKPVEHGAVLRIEEPQRRAGVGQRCQ